MKPVLPFVETMITQVCNLSCQGCSNYSDLKHTGYVTWTQGRQELQDWLQRIHIEEFGIMGGEPMINPEWQEWLQGTRSLMPWARIRFTTNGLLVKDPKQLIQLIQELGDITLKITVHVEDQTLEHTVEQLFRAAAWQPITEFGINRWAGPRGTRLQINRPEKFIKTYQGDYDHMLPWQSIPDQAFAACIQQTCPLLYQGRIYKCSTSGLLKDTLTRFGNPNAFVWKSFVTAGIGIDSCDQDIQQFINNFGRAHTVCGQCPSGAQGQLLHKITVQRK
jgi:hypothetical protein